MTTNTIGRSYLQTVIDEIKPHLAAYLVQHGVADPKSFSCINKAKHNNGDRRPSCGMVPSSGGTAAHCFVCGGAYDIFHFANHFQGLPLSGPEFASVTVTTLAAKFAIEFDPTKIDESMRKRAAYAHAYRDAASFITPAFADMNAAVRDYLMNVRQFNEGTLNTFGVGSMRGTWDDFLSYMIVRGWSPQYLADIGINAFILRPERVIIPVRDEHGSVIAFATRATDPSDSPKYRNTEGTDFYEKGKVLYGLYEAKAHRSSFLYLVEGYLDVLRMAQTDIPNAAAIAGAGIREDHLVAIAHAKFSEVVICLDGDQAGQEGTRHALMRQVAACNDLNVRVVLLPDDHDPDSFIVAEGVEAFRGLPRLSPVSYRLHGCPPDTVIDSPIIEEICEEVAGYQNELKRTRAIDEVGSFFPDHYHLEAIRERVAKLVIERGADMLIEDNKLRKALQRRLNDGDPLDDVLTSGKVDYDHIHRISSAAIGDPFAQYQQTIDIVFESFVNNERGLSLAPLNFLDDKLNGLPTHAALISIGGLPSDGKSSLMRFIAFHVAMNNPDVVVLYLTLDDSVYATMPHFMTIAAAGTLKGREITVSKRFGIARTDLEIVRDRYRNVRNLIVMDSTAGRTPTTMRFQIDRILTRRKHGTKLVVFVDSLHDVDTDGIGIGIRENVVMATSSLKSIATYYNIPVITSLHLRKNVYEGMKPNQGDIAETNKINYDSDIVILLHNELNVRKHRARNFWVGDDGENRPFLEVNVSKNKLPESGWTGTVMLKFDPATTQFWDSTQAEAIAARVQQNILSDDDGEPATSSAIRNVPA